MDESQVAVMADLASTTGATIATKMIIVELRRLNISVSVFDSNASMGEFYFLRRVLAFVACFKGLRKLDNIQILYIPLAAGLASIFQILILILMKKRCKRVIVHHHSYKSILKDPTAIEKIVHLILSHFAEHIFLDEKMMSDYSNIWHPKMNKWIVLNAGFAVSRITESEITTPRVAKNFPTFAHYGNLTTEKGALTVLHEFKVILDSNHTAECILAGPTSESKIFNEIDELKTYFGARFTYLSSFNTETLNEILKRSDFFLFPSTYKIEASPLVVLEAQAAGLIAITSDVGCLTRDVISPGCALSIDNWENGCKQLLDPFLLDWSPQKSSYVSEARIKIRKEMYDRAQITFEQIQMTFRG